MKPVTIDPTLVARCGLYCGACRSYRKGRCPGCAENHKARWCHVRTCCNDRGYASCAQCDEHPDPASCRQFQNPVARVVGLLLNSDRRGCILRLRAHGPERFATFMGTRGRPSLPRDARRWPR